MNKIPEAYTISHSSKKIIPELAIIKEKLESKNINVIFRWSSNRVPHLVINKDKGYSIAWFKRTSKYRIFEPYPSGYINVKRIDLCTNEQVVNYIVTGGLS